MLTDFIPNQSMPVFLKTMLSSTPFIQYINDLLSIPSVSIDIYADQCTFIKLKIHHLLDDMRKSYVMFTVRKKKTNLIL